MSSYKGDVLYIFNGIVRNNGVIGVSGGDLRLFEIIKNTPSLRSHIFTTSNGADLLDKFNIKVSSLHVQECQVTSGALSNLRVSYNSLFHIPSGLKDFRGYVYSSCEHLYDVLPALRLKFTNKCKWYAVYHWVEDYPWKEKRGDTPFLSRYLYWLNRFITGLLIKYFADIILAVSDQTKDKLIQIKKVNPNKIKAVYCGVNYQEIRDITQKCVSEKGQRYDAVFMKRLNYGKGVFDLLQIWYRCCQQDPSLKLAIIGDGPTELVASMQLFIKQHNLDKNIDFVGVLYDVEKKFQVLNSAKLFILPTHEENWAIVIGEAMAAGLPVICYRLKEIQPIWQDNVSWINFGDIDCFAETIKSFLESPAKIQELSEKAKIFVQRYDWKQIARTEFD